MNLDPNLTLHTKSPQVNTPLNVNKTITLLEKKNTESSGTLGQHRFLRFDSQITIHKGKVDKLTLIKMEKFCSIRDLMMRMKGQITDWEQISANRISGKGPVIRIYKLLKGQ